MRCQTHSLEVPKTSLSEQIGGCQRGVGWRVGKMGEGSQKVHTSNYKINKPRGGNVQHGDYH